MVSSAHEAPPSPPPDRQGPNHESLMCVMGSTYTVGGGKCEKTKTKMPLLLAAYVLSLLFSGLFEKSCMFNKHIVFFLVVQTLGRCYFSTIRLDTILWMISALKIAPDLT